MKAIIITFHGEAPEKNYDEIIRRMAELVFNNTSAKIEDISAAVLDDKEVSEALLQKVVIAPVANANKASISTTVKAVSELCSNIINEIGTPSLMNEEVFRKELLKYLLNKEDQATTRVLRIIINTPESSASKVKVVLHNYGLSKLPEIIKGFDSILKLYQLWQERKENTKISRKTSKRSLSTRKWSLTIERSHGNRQKELNTVIWTRSQYHFVRSSQNKLSFTKRIISSYKRLSYT